MSLLLPIVAALVSLVILPGWFFYFDIVPKVVVVLVGAAAVLPFLILRTNWARFTRIFLGLLAAEVLVMIVATLFSTHRWLSLSGSAWRRDGVFAELAILILAAAAAVHLPEKRNLRLFLRITVLAALPIAAYGILQYFGMDPLLRSSAYHFGEGPFMIVRPPSTLGHASYFATYLLYVVFAAAALAQSEISRRWKTAALLISILAIFGIVLSGTRAALLGLLAGAIFAAVRGRLNRRWLTAAAGFAMMLAGFYFSPAGARLRARVFWSSEDMLGGARLPLWHDTLVMSSGRLLTGYGPETFSPEFPRHQSLKLARAFSDFYDESPHNIFLDALISEGIIGFLLLAALSVLGLALARGPLGGAFTAMLVSQQFTSFTVPTELYFYLSLAMLVAARAKPQPLALALRPRLLACFPAVLLAGFGVYLATGDYLLASASRALDNGQTGRAAALLDRAHHWNASADVYFSRRLLDLKAWQPALDAAARAPRTADDPQNALLNLAAFRAGRNDAAGVEQSLRQAIAAAPNWYKPHWLLAQVLARDGRIEEASAEAQAAFDRDGGTHPEVKDTYDRLLRR